MTGADDLAFAGIAAQTALFAARRASPEETLSAHWAQIESRNGALNLLVHIDEVNAREMAAASARRWMKGQPLSGLDGVAIAVKANIAVAGLAWTGGFAAFKDRIAPSDATVVARLRAAGAIVIGVANMHEGALGATTDGPLYGKAFNPIGDGLTPGGSSGGSAAAVAAGFCAAALGSDTLGSVRIPSAYCGIVGIKPTFGLLSRAGVELLSWSLDHVGVHARSPDDAHILLAAIAGHDASDPWSDAMAWSPTSARGLADATVAHIAHADVVCEPGVSECFDAALVRLRAAGARVRDASFSSYDFSRGRRAGLLIAEAEGATLLGHAIAAQPEGFSEGFRNAIAYGARQSAPRLAEAQRMMALARHEAMRLFDEHDVLALPTAPHTAFRHDVGAPPSQADLTALANMIGAPAIALPMGHAANGLPVSLQLIARPGADAMLLAIGQAFASL